jgi:hypothetical protein
LGATHTSLEIGISRSVAGADLRPRGVQESHNGETPAVGCYGVASRLRSSAWRHSATAEQKQIGWEVAVRIEKILCTILDEAHKQQVEEATETLSEGPEEFYRRRLD